MIWPWPLASSGIVVWASQQAVAAAPGFEPSMMNGPTASIGSGSSSAETPVGSSAMHWARWVISSVTSPLRKATRPAG